MTITSSPPARELRRPTSAGTWRRRSRPWGLLGGLVLLVVCLLASLGVGARAVPPTQVLAALGAGWRGRTVSDAAQLVVLDLRLPRTVTAVLAGMALAVAGALVQAVTRNPLADPGILGTTSGSAFALSLAAGVLGFTAPLALLAVAFVGAAVATLAVYAIGSIGRSGGSPVRLVLSGTALGAVLSGITSAITISDPQRFVAMNAWRSGTLADRGWTLIGPALPFLLAGAVLAVALAGSLNAVAMGDDLATSLGADVVRVRSLTVCAITLLAGAATAIAGPIAFLGLIVPHLARWIVGPDQRWILAHCLVLGPTLLLIADVAGRVLIPPAEVPAGIVTAVIGAPVLIALVRRRTPGEL